MSDAVDLDELARLLAAASPLPWCSWHCGIVDANASPVVEDMRPDRRRDGVDYAENQGAIVAAVNAAPTLLAIARAAVAYREAWESFRAARHDEGAAYQVLRDARRALDDALRGVTGGDDGRG